MYRKRGVREAEGARLLSECTDKTVPRVRIPSPLPCYLYVVFCRNIFLRFLDLAIIFVLRTNVFFFSLGNKGMFYQGMTCLCFLSLMFVSEDIEVM